MRSRDDVQVLSAVDEEDSLVVLQVMRAERRPQSGAQLQVGRVRVMGAQIMSTARR